MRISAPQPSVLHLVTLFRMINAGDIRIPAFQRDFVWSEKQMIELLESVNEGFPIGSILLWAVDHKILRIAPSGATAFPDLPDLFPTNYILDGMQRLSTLFGAFSALASENDSRFSLWYDLRNEVFLSKGDVEESSATIPLSSLFSPRLLLEDQSRLASQSDGDNLIDRLLALQAAFQEYMVPVVTIKSVDIQRVVGIFEKINSTGTKLDPVDFMRAITWAEDFDLNHHLDSSASMLAEAGAEIDQETIIKCVGLILNIPPTTDGLLRLRNFSADELTSAFSAMHTVTRRVLDFMRNNLGVNSTSFIPYEGQLLLLFKAIGMEDPNPAEVEGIKLWFWIAGFNEILRGKPDHYVVRAIEDWRGLIVGQVRGLEPRLKLTEEDLRERRLVAGGALSASFSTMYANNKPKSVSSNRRFGPEDLTNRLDYSLFQPVFSRSELIDGGVVQVNSARMLCNLIMSDHVKNPDDIRYWIDRRVNQGDWEILNEHFIDEIAAQAILENRPKDFLECRSKNIFEKIKEITIQNK